MSEFNGPDSLPDGTPQTASEGKNVGVIGRGVRVQWIGQIGFQVIRFLNSIVITNVLGAALYGGFYLGFTLIRLCDILAKAGMESGLVRFVSRYVTLKDESRFIGSVKSAIVVGIFNGIFFAILIMLMSSHVTEWLKFDPTQAVVFVILAFCLPLDVLNEIFLASLRGLKLVQYRVYVEQLIKPIVRLILTALFLWCGLGLNGVALACVFMSIVGTTASYKFLKKHVKFTKPEVTPAKMGKPLLKYSLPLMGSILLNTCDAPISVIFMAYYGSPAEVGILGAVRRFTPLLIIPLDSFNNIFAPIITELHTQGKRERLNELYKTVCRSVLTITLAMAVPALLFAEQILNIFGDDFKDGHDMVLLMVFAYLVLATAGPSGFMLSMTGHPRAVLVNSLVAGSLNIALAIMLIPTYRLVGVGATRLGVVLVLSMMRMGTVYWFYKLHPFSMGHIKTLAATAVGTAAAWGISRHLLAGSPWTGFFLGTGCFLLIYAGALFILGMPKEEIQLYKTLIGKRFGKGKKQGMAPKKTGES